MLNEGSFMPGLSFSGVSHSWAGEEALKNVDLAIPDGEILCLVGPSGCGKTTALHLAAGLERLRHGVIRIGDDIVAGNGIHLPPEERGVGLVFQEFALFPHLSVAGNIAFGLRNHSGRAARTTVRDLLDMVGLPSHFVHRYPHELSGGQLQRVTFARALAVEPELIICDEPVSALDVSIQAQIVNLLKDLQRDFRLTYLFISHDLSVVRNLCDRVAVMYLGRIAEVASRRQLYEGAVHPYTKALMSAVPIPDPDVEATRERVILQGDLPSPSNPPSGCRFRTRCPIAVDRCGESIPELREVNHGQWAACSRISEFT